MVLCLQYLSSVASYGLSTGIKALGNCIDDVVYLECFSILLYT